jgi:hypothetical protein
MYRTPELKTTPRVRTVEDDRRMVVSWDEIDRAFTVSGMTAEPTSFGRSLHAVNCAPRVSSRRAMARRC